MGTRWGVVRSGAVCIIIVSAALVMLMTYMIGRSWSVQRWPETSCEVTGTRLNRSDDDWSALVSWQYKVSGVEYRIVDHDPRAFLSTMTKPEATTLMTRYQVGSKVPCYYDPSEPLTSVLDRTKAPAWALASAMASVCTLIAGIVVVIVSIARGRRRRGAK